MADQSRFVDALEALCKAADEERDHEDPIRAELAEHAIRTALTIAGLWAGLETLDGLDDAEARETNAAGIRRWIEHAQRGPQPPELGLAEMRTRLVEQIEERRASATMVALDDDVVIGEQDGEAITMMDPLVVQDALRSASSEQLADVHSIINNERLKPHQAAAHICGRLGALGCTPVGYTKRNETQREAEKRWEGLFRTSKSDLQKSG